MKIPLSWLKEYVDVSLPAGEVAELFTHLGFEVEGISGGFTPVEGLVVGRVLECKKHPNADKLSLTRVDAGGEPLDIVCGAQNVRAGLTVAVILAGHTLANGMAIKKAKIRGEISNGMICSEAELGLAATSEGILELSGNFIPGEPLGSHHVGAETVLEVAVLSNRPDCLSMVGLARELAAKKGIVLQRPKIAPIAVSSALKGRARISVSDSTACPRYSARLISGVRVAPSPAWLANRLKGVGLRPINNIVDITNFVLMELGHPLHAFDFSKVAGGEIRVRKAVAGESFRALDGREHQLLADDLLICDRDKPVALGGVMGGENSGVTEGATEILLEAAYFEPIGIRRTSRRLGILSDSSYRFERGADPEGAPAALDRATALILELAGGAAGERVEHYPVPISPVKFPASPARINRLLGTGFTADEIRQTLTPLGFICGPGDPFELSVPTFRRDVQVNADLAEEVARHRGYGAIGAQTRAPVDLSAGANSLESFRISLRRYFSGKGLNEAVTASLAHPGQLELLGESADPVRLKNPLSPDFSVMRTSLLPGLLNVVKWNVNRNNADLRFFEMGTVFENSGMGKPPREIEMAGCVFSGRRYPQGWSGGNEIFDLHWIRGFAESLFSVFCKGEVGVKPLPTGYEFTAGGRPLGHMAAVAPKITRAFDIKIPVLYLSLDVRALFGLRVREVKFRPLSKFPPVDRDMAVVVEASAPVDRMAETIRGQSPLIEEVRVFDVFKSDELGSSRKSVAFFIRMRKSEATLTDAEAEGVFSKALSALQKEFGAQLRQ